MRNYNFTVDRQTYTIEANSFTQARSKLSELLAAK
jgi:hypothetical protein